MVKVSWLQQRNQFYHNEDRSRSARDQNPSDKVMDRLPECRLEHIAASDVSLFLARQAVRSRTSDIYLYVRPQRTLGLSSPTFS